MKTLVIGLAILGLTNLAHAQEQNVEVIHVKLKDFEATPAKNQAYFSSVFDKQSSLQVQLVQTEINHYDITKTAIFKNSYDTYDVLFKSAHGDVIASYDRDGKLLKCVEKFEDVLPPPKVREAVIKKYPGWNLNSTSYRVDYHQNRDVKKIYQLQLKKDNEKINLKVNCQGVILKEKRHKIL